ncbi:MAG: MYXO-CTERM sorting domain-containing protein [Myxococcota bacterium]|nr:MYXO-CTERM sorting domain-containing protein [Myxococcota bacterium]
MARFVLVGACLLALGAEALANGRPPQTSTINFRPGNDSEIAAGTSFGLLISKDGGATWRWMCEDALPYGGMYDPDYEIMTSGTLFATTFDGLKVNRDGCVFASTVLAPPEPELKFFSVVARASNNTFYAASADPTDGNVYKSMDEGMSFMPLPAPGQLNDWWQSMEVAPSDPNRIYLSGYRFVQTPDAGTKKVFLLFTSTTAGASWTPLPLTDFVAMSNSTIEIAGVSRTNPLHVFARVTLEDNAIADGIYESTNGGQNWTKILTKMGSIAFVMRANGDLVAGTQTQGVFRRAMGQTTWTELTTAPHINCLVENAAGEVWACTQNYGIPQIPMDGYGIMKSSDLVTWTPVLKYQDIFEPVACPMDTLQYMKCDRPAATGAPLGWCGLCDQLGCDPKRSCVAAVDGPPPKKEGCCETGGSSGGGALAVGAMVGIVLRRRRKKRR